MIDDREYMALKGRVSSLEAQVQFLYKHFGLEFVAEQAFEDPKMAPIYELVKKGDLIKAVMLHRQIYASSLVEAKKVIDDLSTKL